VEGVQKLTHSFKKFSSLLVFKLYLGDNKITDQAAAVLFTNLKPHLTHVREVYLDFKRYLLTSTRTSLSHKVTETLWDFFSALPNIKLVHLYMNSTGVQQSHKSALKAELKKLKTLEKVSVKI